jgi:hypothetical protein
MNIQAEIYKSVLNYIESNNKTPTIILLGINDYAALIGWIKTDGLLVNIHNHTKDNKDFFMGMEIIITTQFNCIRVVS